MLEAVSQKYQGSCVMVMEHTGEEVTFLGSGFLVHPEGYLLTAARTISGGGELVVVPPDMDDNFAPVSREEVSPVPVEVVSKDMDHDVALLKLTPELEINMPSSILGDSTQDARGAMLMTLGIPFGYYRIHGVIASQAILSGRIKSRSGTNMIIFDRRVQYGDTGGPLISVNSGSVIGVVGGVFDPVELEGRETPEGVRPINSDLSYAVSIEYGKALLDKALEEKDLEEQAE
ncbi:MAG: serine protease [Spirochaetaceae bacterium]